jgi:hypothetical protein
MITELLKSMPPPQTREQFFEMMAMKMIRTTKIHS